MRNNARTQIYLVLERACKHTGENIEKSVTVFFIETTLGRIIANVLDADFAVRTIETK